MLASKGQVMTEVTVSHVNIRSSQYSDVSSPPPHQDLSLPYLWAPDLKAPLGLVSSVVSLLGLRWPPPHRILMQSFLCMCLHPNLPL